VEPPGKELGHRRAVVAVLTGNDLMLQPVGRRAERGVDLPEHTDTGARMRGFGVEVWVMRDGKIAVWEAAFNTARADQIAGLAELLR